MRKLLCSFLIGLPLWSCHSRVQEVVRGPHVSASGGTLAVTAASQDTLQVCVVHDRSLRLVPATLDRKSGDTLVVDRRLSDVYPDAVAPYAGHAEWFLARRAIVFEDRGYYWNGPAVTLAPGEVTSVGEYRGIPLFAEPDPSAGMSILFVPVRRGCEFQPYYHFSGAPVRGA